MLIEDSQADPKEAILIAQKFVSDPRVLAVVGDFNSSASMAAAEIYNDGGLVQISPTASHPDFTKKGEYIFRAGTTQSMEGAFLARWAVQDLGHKKISTIYVNNDWGLVANKVFADTAKQLGADVSNQEAFIPGDKDFTAIITKIKEAKPDLVFLATQWEDAALIATQMKTLGFKVDLMGPGSLSTAKLVKNARRRRRGHPRQRHLLRRRHPAGVGELHPGLHRRLRTDPPRPFGPHLRLGDAAGERHGSAAASIARASATHWPRPTASKASPASSASTPTATR